LVAHLAGAADAFEDARGRRRGADRARGADVVRAVRGGPAAEVVALDRALEALALGDARDLDAGAGLERVDGCVLAERQLADLAAELDERAHRRRVRLREVAELGFGEVLLLARAVRELDGLVAVALDGADRRHRARAGLEHGHTRDGAVLLEDLGHAELL